jgi:hypothetical protein
MSYHLATIASLRISVTRQGGDVLHLEDRGGRKASVALLCSARYFGCQIMHRDTRYSENVTADETCLSRSARSSPLRWCWAPWRWQFQYAFVRSKIVE